MRQTRRYSLPVHPSQQQPPTSGVPLGEAGRTSAVDVTPPSSPSTPEAPTTGTAEGSTVEMVVVAERPPQPPLFPPILPALRDTLEQSGCTSTDALARHLHEGSGLSIVLQAPLRTFSVPSPFPFPSPPVVSVALAAPAVSFSST